MSLSINFFGHETDIVAKVLEAEIGLEHPESRAVAEVVVEALIEADYLG